MRKRRHKKKQSEFSWLKYCAYIGVFAVLMLALAVYCLPFVSYYQVSSAITAKDAGKLASHIDLQEMRKNLKGQKGQRIIKTMQKKDVRDPSLVDLSLAWSSLSSDQEIDRAISTEGFYIAFSRSNTKTSMPMKPGPETSVMQEVQKLIERASFQYRSVSQFVVSVKDEDGLYAEYFSFIFKRDGLTWHLSNVILPVF